MKNHKVKSFSFIGGVPTNIYKGIVDVFVTLEDDHFQYWVEIATPQTLSSHMEKIKKFYRTWIPVYHCS